MISANAAGLGKLTVLSALGQPLRAEIELSAVTPEEASGLSVRLAPADAFRTANIDFNPALSALRFEVEQRSGRQVVRVSSSQPLNEPFVDLLLELNWNGGRMVREYTFLLDPPEIRGAQSPQVAAPVDLGPARTPTTTTAPATAPVAARAPAAADAKPAARPAAKATVDEITVKRGDTLSAIASQVKPVDVSLDVMLVALYRANPEAFMGNNMNRLKSGQILAVPDAGAIRAADGDGASSARSVVVAHARDFNAYRARLAGQVANSTPSKDAGTGQSSSGKITAKVEEKPNAVNAARDKLTLSKATADKPGEGKTGAAVEDKIAKQKQVEDASSRVQELEKNVNDLEKLMEVKSKSAATAPVAPAAPAAAEPAASAPAPAPTRMAPVIPPRKLEEPGLFDKLVANSQMVGLLVAGLLVAVVAALAAIAARRRRKFVVPRDESGPDGLDAAPAWDPAPAAPAAAVAGGVAAGVATDAAAVAPVVDADSNAFDTHFAPSASQLDNNEVDPVAEADVYIAYGRDAQAEEILKEALRNHPERHAVRLKLLEIYANRHDARTFESQASELYSLTRGQGDEWAQAARMGRELEPGNPLFASADADSADGFGTAPLAATAGVVAAATAAAAYAAYDHEDTDGDAPAEATAFGAAAGGADAYDTAPAAYAPGLNDDLETALPQAADGPVSPASVAEQANAADFGLGDLDFAAPDPYAQDPFGKVPPDAAPFLQDDNFNLSLDKPAPAPAEEPAYDPSMDFSLDLPAEPAQPAALDQAPAAADADATRVPLDFDAADFTIPDVPALAVPPAEPAPALAPAPAVADKDAAPEFDLSGIDFDLSSQPEPTEPAASAETGRAEPMSALHMEMDTKLDLAVAYQEIGDKEGARELLDEVLRGGSDEQVAKATAMKEQLV
ncbi:pilus assembly protein FimV [Duganella sp. Leaf61]|nr:pilus assembly protein FimV [Duganella sp. Leaf61]